MLAQSLLALGLPWLPMKHLLTFSLLAGVVAPAAAQDMIGVSWTGNVYSVDSGSGAGALVGPSGYTQVNNLAKSPTGVLYACAGYGVPCTVIAIDAVTGVGTAVSTTALDSVRGLAYMGSTLYAINDSSGTGVGVDELYTLNPLTGAATYVGSTGFSGVQGMAAAGGVLYGWDINLGLITIDPVTGAGADVSGSTGGTGSVQNLAANASGGLFGGQNSLYSINPATGVYTLIGSGGYSDLRGLEFSNSGPPSFTLSKSGSCPGFVTLSSANGTPNSTVVVLSGNAGSFTKPGGTCAGMTIPCANPKLRAILGSDGSGAAGFSFNAPAAACGASIVFIDVSTCTPSNAVVL